MSVPLTHPPGDVSSPTIGETTVIIGGIEQKALRFFAFDLPDSRWTDYIVAYPAATSEAWVRWSSFTLSPGWFGPGVPLVSSAPRRRRPLPRGRLSMPDGTLLNGLYTVQRVPLTLPDPSIVMSRPGWRPMSKGVIVEVIWSVMRVATSWSPDSHACKRSPISGGSIGAAVPPGRFGTFVEAMSRRALPQAVRARDWCAVDGETIGSKAAA